MDKCETYNEKIFNGHKFECVKDEKYIVKKQSDSTSDATKKENYDVVDVDYTNVEYAQLKFFAHASTDLKIQKKKDAEKNLTMYLTSRHSDTNSNEYKELEKAVMTARTDTDKGEWKRWEEELKWNKDDKVEQTTLAFLRATENLVKFGKKEQGWINSFPFSRAVASASGKEISNFVVFSMNAARDCGIPDVVGAHGAVFENKGENNVEWRSKDIDTNQGKKLYRIITDVDQLKKNCAGEGWKKCLGDSIEKKELENIKQTTNKVLIGEAEAKLTEDDVKRVLDNASLKTILDKKGNVIVTCDEELAFSENKGNTIKQVESKTMKC